CSAIHPLALGSPFLTSLPLEGHGLRFVHPELPLAHPLDGGRAVALHRSVDETAAALGTDAAAYRRLMIPLVGLAPRRMGAVLSLRLPRLSQLPDAARFALLGVRPATGLARRFHGEEARALVAGTAAHAMQPLTAPATSAFALVLGLLGHAVGWPVAAGGSR